MRVAKEIAFVLARLRRHSFLLSVKSFEEIEELQRCNIVDELLQVARGPGEVVPDDGSATHLAHGSCALY